MTSTHVPTDVTDLNRQWGEAFNAGDLPRLMEFYEPDAVLVPGPGAAPVRGLEAIEASCGGSSPSAARSASPRATGSSTTTSPCGVPERGTRC